MTYAVPPIAAAAESELAAGSRPARETRPDAGSTRRISSSCAVAVPPPKRGAGAAPSGEGQHPQPGRRALEKAADDDELVEVIGLEGRSRGAGGDQVSVDPPVAEEELLARARPGPGDDEPQPQAPQLVE